MTNKLLIVSHRPLNADDITVLAARAKGAKTNLVVLPPLHNPIRRRFLLEVAAIWSARLGIE